MLDVPVILRHKGLWTLDHRLLSCVLDSSVGSMMQEEQIDQSCRSKLAAVLHLAANTSNAANQSLCSQTPGIDMYYSKLLTNSGWTLSNARSDSAITSRHASDSGAEHLG